MEKFKISVIMLQKIRPRMFDENWLRATKLLRTLSKKSTKDKDKKMKLFCYLVDEIYKEEEKNQ